MKSFKEFITEKAKISDEMIDKLKRDGFYDAYKKLAKNMTKNHIMTMELKADGSISSLEIMPKDEFDEMSKDKNWPEAVKEVK